MKKNHTIAAIIYRTYLDRRLDIPYFRTIITIAFSLFLHLVQAGLLLKIPSQFIIPFNSKNKMIEWFQAALYFVILIIVISLLFPKHKLEEQKVSTASILKAKKILPWYLIETIFLLIVLLLKHGVEKGAIHL